MAIMAESENELTEAMTMDKVKYINDVSYTYWPLQSM